ncbi:hypothetical protein CH330_03500 [candidate division WOR-3 bacterium JGI_Cruoil_03_51_56]|uniref:Peptidase M6-like domain-containing protein n=1 Tax=candidate division WOR-3 bacterium JGI_Cruoil_03_51_56 TaxID=1973747 RepID=A0A235BV22_UNCW3|nr:MAG: hypothetical protein CH330_03500 [candidate division WOR-3 bacterium JGI_Cruoil_03_51_56]
MLPSRDDLWPFLLSAFGLVSYIWAMPPLPGPSGRPVAQIIWPGTVESPGPVKKLLDQPRHLLVVLVDFNDNIHSYQQAGFQKLLFGTDEQSMTDYYLEASYSNLMLSGRVEEWYRMDEPYSFYLGDSFGIYGQFPHNSQGLVTDLVRKADQDIDFSQYDGDNDGIVDGLLIIHAGPGAEETGNNRHIWSHKWQLSDPCFGSPGPVQTNDGVSVDVFSIQPERFENSGIISIGVFCHEFGHVLGLPDLYDTDYSSSGIGRFCLMAAGAWARSSESEPLGSSPVHPCAWCKYLLGWVQPESLEQGLVDSLSASIVAAATEPCCYRLLPNPLGVDWRMQNPGRGEYFLVENRQRIGFDAGLPGSGLLILHIDESRPNNNNENRPLVGILQADRSSDYALPANDRGSDADLWKESDTGVASFTIPSTAFYDGVQTGVAVRNISASDSVMTADLEIEPLFLGEVYSFPNPVVVESGQERATIIYEPTDSRLVGKFPKFEVRIYNLAAEPVRVLDKEPDEINYEHRAAYWDLKDDKGQPVPSGMYFYTVKVEENRTIEQNKGRLTIVR